LKFEASLGNLEKPCLEREINRQRGGEGEMEKRREERRGGEERRGEVKRAEERAGEERKGG
jgi:hypothetical protein